MASPAQGHVVVPGSPDVTTSPTDTDTGATGSTSQKSKNDLAAFRLIVGIEKPSNITPPSSAEECSTSIPNRAPATGQRPAKNISLYKRIVDLERQSKWEYRFYTILINTCLLAQIAFAAILTALGASEAPHNVITVFGAINVAIAGILALLKGQGLPERPRKDWVGLQKVRGYIDEREMLLELGVYLGDEQDREDKPVAREGLDVEIQKVLAMYDNQLATMEANRPDVYVFPGAGAKTVTS